MYKGFDLLFEQMSFDAEAFSKFYKRGQERYQENKEMIRESLDSLILNNGNLDGSKMQENWFPQIEADIFLSHSHRDEAVAIALSEWLHMRFGLSTFIDSCIWGYHNDLLKIIDDEYCKNPEGNSYNYNKRNYSTSHVHMMLSTALSMMIDNTECILFLNTPNSISSHSIISKTESPWIYSEIAMTKLVRKKHIREYRLQRITESFSSGGRLEKGLDFEYVVDKEHLTKINSDVLGTWSSQWPYKGNKYSPDKSTHSLDSLYKITLI